MADRRVAVVTGANSGIGKAAARALTAQGWQVIGTGRDPVRIKAAEQEIAGAAANGGSIEMLRADLSLLAEADHLADAIMKITPRIDVLINNAGGMVSEKVMTREGLEASFAGNHLGPFVLTDRLRPLLRAAATGKPAGTVRILMTASDASEMIPGIDLSDMQCLDGFNPGRAYCNAKLANVLFARALAGRLAQDGIVAHAVHPGAIDSNFFSHAPADTRERVRDLEKGSEEEGADTLVWLATAPEGGASSGSYWYRRARRAPNPLVDDPATVERFWVESENLVATAKRQATG